MVLVTSGKGQSNPDYATVIVMDDYDAAVAFCEDIESKNKGVKYWKSAQIVESGREIDLTWSDE
jgi:hypothetical protein